MWEGGCRVVAAIYSPLIKSPQRVSHELMHVTDLLPTLAAIANITIKDSSIDGVNQWETISIGEDKNFIALTEFA
jgi:arylsulfatase A-like enzyme